MDVSVKRIVRSIPLVLALMAAPVLADRVQYRWVDDAGNILFTDAPPNGIVYQVYRNGVPREMVYPETNEAPAQVEKSSNKMVPIYTEKQKRDMSDKLLLLKYSSIEKIDEDMQVELDHLKYDFRLLESESNSLTKTLYGLIRSAADSQRAKKAIADTQREKIEGVRERLRNNERELARLESRSQSIEEEFESKRKRYRSLTSNMAGTG